jgi:hypothetical protein
MSSTPPGGASISIGNTFDLSIVTCAGSLFIVKYTFHFMLKENTA